MDKLNFYTVDLDYVQYLKDVELASRGFSRVPDMDYGQKRKPKFLCGIVLKIDSVDYYVPVSSYKQQKKDNILIRAENGEAVGSLRFNYMFPIPIDIVRVRRSLLSQELRFCIEHQDTIMHDAERTYKRVLLGKDVGLVRNSCDFKLLEEACLSYVLQHTSHST